MPIGDDVGAKLSFDVLELDPRIGQDQQHIGALAQSQLHHCALPHLDGE